MGYGDHVTEVLYGGDYNPEQWSENVCVYLKMHISI